jgi:hypothetical protein
VPSNFANKWLCSNGLTLAQNLIAVVESLKGSLEQKSQDKIHNSSNLIYIIVSGPEPDCGGGVLEGKPGAEEPGENP